MNLKLKAFARTVGVISVATVSGMVITTAFDYFGPVVVGNVIGYGILFGLVYLMYSLILGQLEAEEKIKSLTDKS
jgi:formate/nitrite transporter FocA (FNT family)